MAVIRSDYVKEEEEVSIPIWFKGWLDYREEFFDRERRLLWYCVDVSIDDLFLQREIRISKKRKQQSINHKEDRDVCNLTDGNPIFLKKCDKLGLEILPESIPFSHGNRNIQSSTTLTLGSFIYCAGGYTYSPFDVCRRNRSNVRLSKNLCCFDTKNQFQGWKTFKMITGRLDPLMAAVDGKIYIMGGKNNPLRSRNYTDYDEQDDGYGDCDNGDDGDTGPWAEVFDPDTGRTEPMPDLPDEFLDDSLPVSDEIVAEDGYQRPRNNVLEERCIVVFTNQNSIVFCSRKSGRRIYYEINKQSWSSVVVDKVLASHIRMGRNYISAKKYVVVGSTIYWMAGHLTISAYDFTNRRLYKSGDIQHICKEWRNFYEPEILIHLNGDDFCIVWIISNKNNRNYELMGYDKMRKQINCTKVKIRCVDNTDSSESLGVSLIYSHIYAVDHSFLFLDALLVDA